MKTVFLVLISTSMLQLSLLNTTAHAQEEKEAVTTDQVWESLTGHWIRYSGDNIIHKVITKGQEKHFGTSQYGEPKFEAVNPMVLSKEGNIFYFTKLDPKSKEPVYKGAFKVHDDVYYEYSRGLFADAVGKPVLWKLVRIEDPVAQLHIACREGDTDKVLELLESGVSPNQTLEGSYAPLAYAAAAGHIDIVQLLLEKGADVNQKARFGKTPLNHAVGGGSIAACDLLIKRGASLAEQNFNGGNLIHEAAFWGQPKLIPFLLEKGVGINDGNKNGATPLLFATYWANWFKTDEQRAPYLECIRVLLANGADADIQSSKGESARSIANESGIKALKELF
ncbi:MAG: ankyrin repeat domain-containing protein [Planctomycetota bacterium]|nr:ankyrin repeat domain-containing protein [Planctomycetota bacterium]